MNIERWKKESEGRLNTEKSHVAELVGILGATEGFLETGRGRQSDVAPVVRAGKLRRVAEEVSLGGAPLETEAHVKELAV